MDDLKNCIRKYQRIDNELQDLNKTVYSLREDRKIVELEMVDVVKQTQFETINTFKLEDGSTIRIQRTFALSVSFKQGYASRNGQIQTSYRPYHG